jgi:23S rRNA (cytosine1962-C5)-methyltransferase
MTLTAENWIDFELIDAGEGEKLERWGKYLLRRPDPQAIWSKNFSYNSLWEKPDLFYHRADKGGGYWDNLSGAPQNWQINYSNLTFNIKPTGFKHTGLFPEQSSNWDWIIERVQKYSKTHNTSPKILNLFAYTGGATVAAASAGAEVCHVDASKGMTEIAKQNILSSNLVNAKVRFIVDDVVKFVQREIRRGNKYEGIIMDPPVYGRGSSGQLWQIEKDLVMLVDLCTQILSDSADFFLINAYATEYSNLAIGNVLREVVQSKSKGEVTSGELALPVSKSDMVLPCGIFGRWSRG